MSPVLPSAGSGPKITTRFKAKLFSFADILIHDNRLSFYQISEPLLSTSSATPSGPAPFGTEFNGKPVNDPIPDTLVDPSTGNVVSPPADGSSVLLDKFVVTKPELDDQLRVDLEALGSAGPGSQFTYRLQVHNRSSYNLNGTQAVFTLPKNITLVNSPDGTTTQVGDTVVVTVGRLAAGAATDIQLVVTANPGVEFGDTLTASALVRSSTALPSESVRVRTHINPKGD
jgi:hypothetical protein